MNQSLYLSKFRSLNQLLIQRSLYLSLSLYLSRSLYLSQSQRRSLKTA